jgi:hypothetical protein
VEFAQQQKLCFTWIEDIFLHAGSFFLQRYNIKKKKLIVSIFWEIFNPCFWRFAPEPWPWPPWKCDPPRGFWGGKSNGSGLHLWK